MSDYDRVYYYSLRCISRYIVAESMIARMKSNGGVANWEGMTLASIDTDALEYARLEWPKYYGNTTHQGFQYSWERLHHQFSHRPSHFDLAIWQIVNGRRVLQGLALGRPSNAKTHLTLNWIERSFADTYFRGGILLPILACAIEYAKLLGCSRVLIKDAVDPTVYQRYGFRPYTPAKRVHGTYLYKKVRDADEICG